jgi:hypothetical protein
VARQIGRALSRAAIVNVAALGFETLLATSFAVAVAR